MDWSDFQTAHYDAIWLQQKQLVQERIAGERDDIVLMGEHFPVITLGRGSHVKNLLNPSIPLVEIERGGDVTYHGPGQLIAYPIFLLPPGQRDLHQFLRHLEEVIIITLKEYDLTGVRNPGWTGVWVQDIKTQELCKIASIGVAVKKWVTYHGLSLNVNTDLQQFQQINPCGLNSAVMTSMAQLSGKAIDMNAVKKTMLNAFQQVFAHGSEPSAPSHFS